MAQIISQTKNSVTIQVTIPFGDSLLESEELIQDKLNEVGVLATHEALSQFDADGSPLKIGEIPFTSKGQFHETYQTPYGSTRVLRHVYQSSAGGRTFCPLEDKARLILNATPRFAKIVTFKYANIGATMLARDLLESNGRSISHGYVKSLADTVGAIAQAKEEHWEYTIPKLDRQVVAVGIGLDGTCMYLRKDGWREAMTGTLSLYDRLGERLHTIYIASTPEYGKARFYERFTREIEAVKTSYPEAKYIGLADGAPDNWTFLKNFVDRQVLDFWHASEYVGMAAEVIYGKGSQKKNAQRENWLEDALHNLKHKPRSAVDILDEMKSALPRVKGKSKKEKLEKAATYFENHHHQMWYSRQVKQNLPIGSGVTEAACKVLVKQRLCNAGMRWKDDGALAVLTVRALVVTPSRWTQFWNRFSQFGHTA